MSIPENITRLDEQLTDLKTTCTVFQTASIALLAPVVVTSWLTRDRRDTPTRITTGLLVSVVLLSTTVLLGSTMDYRIPNPNNEIVAMFTGIALVDRDWCKTQAIAYQFFIWNVMGFWIAVVMALHHVVSKKPTRHHRAPSDTQVPPGKVTPTEWKVYGVIYGVSAVFTITPLVIEQFLGINNTTGEQLQIYTADNMLLWCWLASSGGGGILPDNDLPWSQIVFCYGWMVIVFVFSVVFSIKILCRLCAMRRNRHFVAADSSNVISDYIWRHSMFLGLFVLVLAAALVFATNETIATVNDDQESFVALKIHIIVVCGLGVWCFAVFGTHCIRCGGGCGGGA